MQYEGKFKLQDRVMTPKGPGYIGALYPDAPYYEGRCVQVTFDSASPGPTYVDGEYVGNYEWRDGDNERFRDEDLVLLEEEG